MDIPRRGRLFRTRSGNLVDAQELRRRREAAAAAEQRKQQEQEQERQQQKQQRELETVLLDMVLEGIGQLSVVNMCMDDAGRWRIQMLPTELDSYQRHQQQIDP
ncbi:hypothetical protein SLS62_006348 [Diatrype stigma]|uniref:Uncharacterized protein n=1 Tax=Diatrype stigma TaxID=117547 RepID=A0AAN9UQV4_9PEZI